MVDEKKIGGNKNSMKGASKKRGSLNDDKRKLNLKIKKR